MSCLLNYTAKKSNESLVGFKDGLQWVTNTEAHWVQMFASLQIIGGCNSSHNLCALAWIIIWKWIKQIFMNNLCLDEFLLATWQHIFNISILIRTSEKSNKRSFLKWENCFWFYMLLQVRRIELIFIASNKFASTARESIVYGKKNVWSLSIVRVCMFVVLKKLIFFLSHFLLFSLNVSSFLNII